MGWLNRDPIFEAGGVNLYGFVSNRPTFFVDPFGLVIETTGPNAATWRGLIDCWKAKLPDDSRLKQILRDLDDGTKQVYSIDPLRGNPDATQQKIPETAPSISATPFAYTYLGASRRVSQVTFPNGGKILKR